ncbi:MAG TPA: Fic family protein [Polyangiales bacterium]|nr:Fic family protein [Polyangiales bacterium]
MRASKSGSIEERVERLRALEARTSPEALADYRSKLDMSWIHHDSAIEGVVYEPQELVAALRNAPVSDSALLPVHDEIRQYKSAIDFVRRTAADPKIAVDLELIQQIYVILAPDELEAKYRKDIPLHRLYFHEITPPDKIPLKMKALVQWLESDETQRTMHASRIASRAHYLFLQAYPYPKHSGRVGRLMMNLMLLRQGYPPAILHATDRQRYYEALRTSADATSAIVQEALENSLHSTIRYFQRLHGQKEDSF